MKFDEIYLYLLLAGYREIFHRFSKSISKYLLACRFKYLLDLSFQKLALLMQFWLVRKNIKSNEHP